MSELVADGIHVVVTCVARQPYYRWLKAPMTSRELEYESITTTQVALAA